MNINTFARSYYTLQCPHRSMKELGIENFKFEVIDTVDYIDKEKLLIRESVYMNEYNSIETGYNMKHSIDLQNLY